MKLAGLFIATALALAAQPVLRFPENPLITQQLSPALGDDINGPSLMRVPSWVDHPLGRYYLYFAHHKGTFIRMAYADDLKGPWKIYEPGVLDVKDSAFYRLQPDLSSSGPNYYTHIASPEVVLDDAHKRFVMLVHGWFTDGKRWPGDPKEAARWVQENGYGQQTQTATSTDGLHFIAQPGITMRTSYARLFRWHGTWYTMARLGVLGRGERSAVAIRNRSESVRWRSMGRTSETRSDVGARRYPLCFLLRNRRCAGANYALDRRTHAGLAHLARVDPG